MRTIDAASYLQAKLAQQIANYPAGSVSKRDVIYELPTSDEETYGKLNAALTKLVWDEAESALKNRLPNERDAERLRMSDLAVQICRKLT